MNTMTYKPEHPAYPGATPPQPLPVHPSPSASTAHNPPAARPPPTPSPTTHIRHKFKFRWQSKEQLDISSPSRKDGLDAEKEGRWRRQYTMLIHDLGQTLSVPMWCIAAAVMLCHRFYAAKSMLKNDRFVIALACLFLASKVEETPKHIRKVVEEGVRYLNSRKMTTQQINKMLEDKVVMEERKEEILMAERAILYTLGFQLNIHHPYKYLLEKLNAMNLLNLPSDSPYTRLMQDTWNLINDSLRTSVCMQYRPEHLAYTCLFLAAHINMVELPIPSNTTFWVFFNIGQEELRGICKQLFDTYEAAKAPELAELNQGVMPKIHGSHLKFQPPGSVSLVLDGDAQQQQPSTTTTTTGGDDGAPSAIGTPAPFAGSRAGGSAASGWHDRQGAVPAAGHPGFSGGGGGGAGVLLAGGRGGEAAEHGASGQQQQQQASLKRGLDGAGGASTAAARLVKSPRL